MDSHGPASSAASSPERNDVIRVTGTARVVRSSSRNLGRRGFVDWLLASSAGGLMVAVAYPVIRYLLPPAAPESAVNSVILQVKAADVEANTGLIFQFGSKPGILVRTPAGELRAFSAICTHLGCTVQFREDLGHIWCACHNGHFDLAGRNIAGPPPRPLTPYDVNVRGDQVVVSRRS